MVAQVLESFKTFLKCFCQKTIIIILRTQKLETVGLLRQRFVHVIRIPLRTLFSKFNSLYRKYFFSYNKQCKKNNVHASNFQLEIALKVVRRQARGAKYIINIMGASRSRQLTVQWEDGTVQQCTT